MVMGGGAHGFIYAFVFAGRSRAAEAEPPWVGGPVAAAASLTRASSAAAERNAEECKLDADSGPKEM